MDGQGPPRLLPAASDKISISLFKSINSSEKTQDTYNHLQYPKAFFARTRRLGRTKLPLFVFTFKLHFEHHSAT